MHGPLDLANASPPLEVVWGLGTGRRVRALLREGARVEVLALDVAPDDASRVETIIGACALLGDARRAGRLAVHVGTPAQLGDRWRSIAALRVRPRIHVDAAALDRAPESARTLARAVLRLHDERRDHARFGARLRMNLVENLEAICDAEPLSRFAGAAKGRPGFVVAAGPSARAAVPWLREAAAHGPIIAVDTALPLLRAHDVDLDWLVSVDPHAASTVHLGAGTSGVARLAFQPYCTPAMVRAFDRRVLALPAGDPLCDRVARELAIPSLPVAGTVLLYALQIAQVLGCDPVVVVGADLAHVGGRSHATGTATAHAVTPSGTFALDTSGNPVATTQGLLGFLAAVEQHVAGARSRSWFVDGGGARVRGARMIDAAAIRRWLRCHGDRLPAWPADPPAVEAPAAAHADARACWLRLLAEVDAG
jgi:hypothetical protein